MNVVIGRYGLLAAAVVSLAACGDGEAENASSPTRLTATVTRGDLILRAEATGTIEPVRRVEVKSKASGEILTLHVDVGDQVERGALLAEIDPRDVRNNFNQVQADLEVARARLEISRAQLERSEQLLAAEVITQQEHETARLDYTNAQAALIRAQTNFELAQLQLNDVSIRAPMDGTIIQKNVEEGAVIQSASQNVSGGTVLFVMADLAEMQVRTLVDETDMGMIRPGMEAAVTVEAFPDRTFRGIIEIIEPQAVVEQNVTMFPVIVALDNSSRLLRPGMNAEVVIHVDEARDVLMAPNNAIVGVDDVGPAALALGLDLDQLDLSPFMALAGDAFGGPGGGGARAGGDGERFRGERGAEGRGSGEPGAEEPGPDEPGADEPDAGETGPADRGADEPGGTASARGPRARAGTATPPHPDSLRAAVQALRAGGALASGAGRARTEGGERELRPGAVFVVGPDGTPEPRLIQMGIGDWENTQIVSGVQEGDVLVIVGAAQLQAQQEAFLEQVRGRMGGQNPFGGGMPGGRGGFRIRR
ncbi:MAG TPA: efflux RND transporter periplasmic adaptor subunit [Longimicrobiales bacterium]|nr:efflux RND transporter periplasmic adaptor subunit [Longimicrobiales bacterium]